MGMSTWSSTTNMSSGGSSKPPTRRARRLPQPRRSGARRGPFRLLHHLQRLWRPRCPRWRLRRPSSGRERWSPRPARGYRGPSRRHRRPRHPSSGRTRRRRRPAPSLCPRALPWTRTAGPCCKAFAARPTWAPFATASSCTKTTAGTVRPTPSAFASPRSRPSRSTRRKPTAPWNRKARRRTGTKAKRRIFCGRARKIAIPGPTAERSGSGSVAIPACWVGFTRPFCWCRRRLY